jgi:hypothetical protein
MPDDHSRPLSAEPGDGDWLACELARTLTLAGFTMHHCARSHPLGRLGGVCLLPVPGSLGPVDCAGVVVSWTTHRWTGTGGANTRPRMRR